MTFDGLKRKKNCMVFTPEDLSEVLSKLFNSPIECVADCYEGFDINYDETCFKSEFDEIIWYDIVKEKLSEFYHVHVTSIHVDQYDSPLIWVCYKD